MKKILITGANGQLGRRLVKEFTKNIKSKAIGREIVKSTTPGQMIIKIVNDEIENVLGDKYEEINLKSQPPVSILVVGLQGSGKTTTTAKLAKFIVQNFTKKVLLVSLDTSRPAAQDQLKILADSIKITCLPINHLEGHIFSNFLAYKNLDYPFICLLVSGGHTQLWLICGIGNYKLLGETRDDAAGEAFDKGARILGLGYPGGPEIEKHAKKGNPNKIYFPRSLLTKDSLEFSFSGLKTSLLYFMDDFKENSEINKYDVVASYQQAIIETLVEKVKRALNQTRTQTCVIAGGVAANKSLRKSLNYSLHGKKIIYPDLSFCTDNAAMISYLREIKFRNNKQYPLDFSVIPNQKLV